MEHIGIIGFAFGQQATYSSGPSNEVIGEIMQDVAIKEGLKKCRAFTATQWEVDADAPSNLTIDCVVSHYGDIATHYIDTEGVLKSALTYFAQQGVRRVVIVAHPLHFKIIKLFLRLNLWRVDRTRWDFDFSYEKWCRQVPYDKSSGNQQWWTSDPLKFLAYLFKAAFTRRHGA